MSRDLPARASLEHLKKQAKALLRAATNGDEESLARLRTHSGRSPTAAFRLADAQHTIAREYGFATWRAQREHVESREPGADPLALLAAAIKSDDVARAAEVLRRHSALRARLDDAIPGGDFGATALLTAVHRKSRAMIDLLLAHGADVNARSHWWAGSFGVLDSCDPEFAPFLMVRGATVDANAAARLGMLDRLEALVARDAAAVHARGGDGQTPLHVAKNVEVARFLVDHGADIDARDVDHESTPAQYVIGDRPEIARFLVERGCATDLLLAAALGDLPLARRHLEVDPELIRMSVSPEWFPMKNAHAGGTIYIWTLGQGKTPLALARERGHGALHAMLLERSPEEVRLVDACAAGDEVAINAMLARDPSLARTLPERERGAIAEAAWNEQTAAVRLMLAAGWPADARGRNGVTALHNAAWLGNAAIVRELLRHGAPTDVIENQFGGTPLGWALHGSRNSWRAAQGDYVAVVEALLDAGAPAPPVTPELAASDAVRAVLLRRASPDIQQPPRP